jgi:uncharacterized protein (TIGR02266 family)
MERREDPRYAVRIRVDCASRDAFVSNYVMNISKGGVFIRTESPLARGSPVDLTLDFPDLGQVLRTKGRVVWTYDVPKGTARLVTGMGIRFEDMTPESRAQLERYLEGLAASGAEQV